MMTMTESLTLVKKSFLKILSHLKNNSEDDDWHGEL